MPRRKKKATAEGEVEANLIPIMNIMLLLIPALLLAMEVASFAAVNVSPPKYAATADQKKEDEKKEEPLNLKVFIMEDGYRISAQGQQVGAEAGKSADSTRPTIPLAKPGAPLDDFERYDYAALEAQAKKFKQQFPNETVVTISAENTIPMQVLVSTMDALRGSECKLLKIAQGEEPPPECYFWQPIVEAGAG
ncbi:MAG: biopolymer transporter ExbD [Deltaproteobacteria bacterium]|nr:MAG: biopolymer transporter ExbD [Deltaproteobacteria bacterium]